MVELTAHACERAKERKIGTGESIYKNAQKAYERGKSPDDFGKEVRKYLNNVLKGSKGNNVKVYGNFVYIFFNNILITTFPLSQKLLQKENRGKRG